MSPDFGRDRRKLARSPEFWRFQLRLAAGYLSSHDKPVARIAPASIDTGTATISVIITCDQLTAPTSGGNSAGSRVVFTGSVSCPAEAMAAVPCERLALDGSSPASVSWPMPRVSSSAVGTGPDYQGDCTLPAIGATSLAHCSSRATTSAAD